ncbi:hypothetical protein CLPU_2c01740 [Gottschalkia purinilytica]|uniref:F0F1-ATPase subunit n=1 Tax=Gottschalkia purinilytica TaxID=1503 RepID=A0A0L0WE16_GOTPU|nr:hypothetical protein CLPU_2c01740 [Gottschalkia purinilytica]
MKINNKSKILENVALISQIGISMIVPILGGVLLGKFIDDKLGINLVFLTIFTVFGIATSFHTLFKLAGKDIRKKRK